MKAPSRSTVGVLVLLGCLGFLAARGLHDTDAGARVPPAPASVETSLGVAVDALRVDDSAAPRPYARAEFGQRWSDVEHDGCDQRNDTLARDLVEVVYRAGTHDCVVERGILNDPYTGEQIRFEKTSTGGGVDIDHVVPLGDAWASGAWSWTPERREQYANTLDVLQATDAATNRAKGDQSVATWLPPDPAYTCTYVRRWVAIKTTWSLTVTTSEHDRLLQLARAC